MKFEDIIRLSFLNFKSNKFKSIIYILIMTILITIIICTSSGINSLNKFSEDYQNQDFRYRMIGIETENYNNEELKQTLENMKLKYVTTIFKDSNAFFQYVKYKEKGSIELYGNYKGINYILDSGRDIQNDNEIICPSKMYPGNWTEVHNINEYIDMKSKIGEFINIHYNKYYIIDDYNEEIINTYNYDLKLVGTFDVEENLTEYDICYVSTNFFEKVAKEKESIRADKNYINIYEEWVYVLVDSYKNVESVKKTLSNAGYNLEMYYELDLEPFYQIEEIINKTKIVIIVISSICAYLFIKSTLLENNKSIALYELIGYNKKDIKLIYLFQYLINLVISFIIGIILSHIIRIIIVNILSKDPNYSVLNIFISYEEGLLYFVIVSVLTLVSIILLFATKIKKNSPIKLMEGKL